MHDAFTYTYIRHVEKTGLAGSVTAYGEHISPEMYLFSKTLLEIRQTLKCLHFSRNGWLFIP